MDLLFRSVAVTKKQFIFMIFFFFWVDFFGAPVHYLLVCVCKFKGAPHTTSFDQKRKILNDR